MLEKIRNLGLRWKFGAVIFLALLLVAVILWTVLLRALNREFDTLYGDPSTKAAFVADLLTGELKPIFAQDIDAMEVQQELDRTLKNVYRMVYGMYSVRYLFVVNSEGQVLADTFKAAVPASLLAKNPVSQEEQCIPFDSSGNTYVDCKFPIELVDKTTDKTTTGALRVGILDQNPHTLLQKIKNDHIDSVFNPIFYTSLLLAIMCSVLVTLAFWYVIVRRILFLSEATERMSFGDLETAVPVKSQDEIGTLEDTLERMRANLKDAIERLKRRK